MKQNKDGGEEIGKLRSALRRAGYSSDSINAAWPRWWSEEKSASPEARAELKFALARFLGIEQNSLSGERVEFVWNTGAKFKKLSFIAEHHRALLTSFCTSFGLLLIKATPHFRTLEGIGPKRLRDAITYNRAQVDLYGLVAACWGLGIPVVQLRVSPLKSKFMQAIVVKHEDRFAVLINRDANYPSPLAFVLGHELGHISRGHLRGGHVFVEQYFSSESTVWDSEETEADQFALELLTGQSVPDIVTSDSSYSGAQLAKAAMVAGGKLGIEPGILTLCLAHKTGDWKKAMVALKYIFPSAKPQWNMINGVAKSQISRNAISSDEMEYVDRILGTSPGE